MPSKVTPEESEESFGSSSSSGGGTGGDAALARLRLADSLSSSYPGMSLSAALQSMASAERGGEDDPLSDSCFAAIRLERGPPDHDEDEEEDEGVGCQDGDTAKMAATADDDEELTSLAWLQDANLLKSFGAGRGRLCPSPPADASDEESVGEGKENGAGPTSQPSTATVQQHHGHQHPSHVPYNPLKHINSKPPYSFSCLIFMAIEDAPDKRLPVKDIYSWILGHFPYFQGAPTGWKNSVRHNLSLNKCFKKVDKDKGSNIGKGSYWCIDPDYRPNLLQALRKTPYHPYHQLQMMSNATSNGATGSLGANGQLKMPLAPRINGATISPHLFPFLSRRLALSGHAPPNASLITSELNSDIDVANALVSLKSPSFVASGRHHTRSKTAGSGARSRSPSPPEFGSEEDRRRKAVGSRRRRGTPLSPVIVTEAPSEDHTYISTNASGQGSNLSPASSSIDGEYEFGCHRTSGGHADDDSCHSEHSDYDDDKDGSDYDDAGDGVGDDFDSEEDMEVDGCHNGDVVVTVAPGAACDSSESKEIDGIDALLNLAAIATSVMEGSYREEVVV